jgi:hypothetical protein
MYAVGCSNLLNFCHFFLAFVESGIIKLGIFRCPSFIVILWRFVNCTQNCLCSCRNFTYVGDYTFSRLMTGQVCIILTLSVASLSGMPQKRQNVSSSQSQNSHFDFLVLWSFASGIESLKKKSKWSYFLWDLAVDTTIYIQCGHHMNTQYSLRMGGGETKSRLHSKDDEKKLKTNSLTVNSFYNSESRVKDNLHCATRTENNMKFYTQRQKNFNNFKFRKFLQLRDGCMCYLIVMSNTSMDPYYVGQIS